MSNLEYLETVKKDDNDDNENKGYDVTDYSTEFRQMKALEIIAEELCLFNKNIKLIFKDNELNVNARCDATYSLDN